MAQESPTADDDDLTIEAVALTDGAYTLLVADFDDVDSAWEACESLATTMRK